ncbi:hypothetical protein DB30_04852 [Enhygromyxa salina]|uniref:Tetratricopeptide repeat protein n=1 Tax=Enhygromyxa salina TaxID=215803 RepID=A0A0C2D3C4_9BACT|nr:tetratricopeptide repeat protein [Enhygromyxa salina]KIG16240.1 hypothetical protein DB30_04852 [Enhygromyxa salina]
MAYVRNHGNQIAIVHGERDPETRKVQQQVLFTICSRPEAQEVLGRGAGNWRLDYMLEQRYPQIRFDWDRIRAGIEERMDTLPDIYPYRAGEVLGQFRHDLCAFTRQLGHADPQCMYSASELLREHRIELEYLRDLIDWRLSVCDQEPDQFNGDNAFYWRRRLQPNDEPPEVIEMMAKLDAEGDLDRLEALARLFIDCYDNYAEGHIYLGVVAQRRGDVEAAVEHFERAIEQGRKLFPKRLAKQHYWSKHETRPYMRAMRSLAGALQQLSRYDEALEICERMERECGDVDAAETFRADIYLNMGRWSEARKAAERLVEIWPEHAYVAAFAALEQGDRDGALQWFLHGTLMLPRTGQILLGRRISRPQGSDEVRDHNLGVAAVESLADFLAKLSRSSRAFFKAILDTPTTQALLTEVDEVAQRWEEERRRGVRDAYDRMQELRSVAFSREIATQVRAEMRR